MLTLAPGEVIAGRYSLRRRFGQGSHGDVWEAQDALTGDRVAVKVLSGGDEPARVRKEVSALRLLRIPGVVRLLDDGVERGRQFLVMEPVDGIQFPGTIARTWEGLAGVTTALLETLARIHSAGVVHRDIKPGNVLVDATGMPIVLDFGLAYGALGDSTIVRDVGTPAYMAPEQARGEETTARADLFAVGVMLYEALAGRLPHEGANLYALLFAKAHLEPTPLRDVAPRVSAAIAGVIDRMVARVPADRPASAAEVLRLLRGEASVRRAEDELARLGGEDAVRSLVSAGLAARSMDVVGPHGSGRSRTIREATEALVSEGRRVVSTAPGHRPFASLEPVLGEVEDGRYERIEDVTEITTSRLLATLAAGVVVVADDAEHLDRWTAELLKAVRDHGSVIRALLPESVEGGAEHVTLHPLEESALRRLFSGPERLFHVPSDAARALWSRSEGWPARVVDELSAWVRAGLARRDGDQFAISREALDRLAASGRVAPLLRGSTSMRITLTPRPTLARHLEEVLVWMSLAWPNATLSTLSSAMVQPRWRIEAEARELGRLGVARRHADGAWEPSVVVSAEAVWDAARRRAAHRALADALMAGTEGRLVHLVASAPDDGAASGLGREIATEAVALAQTRAMEGSVGHAIATLSEGLLAARRVGELGDAEGELLGAWLVYALEDGTLGVLDRLLYEVSRSRSPGGLPTLVQAAITTSSDSPRALSMLEALAPFDDPSLERCRNVVRMKAARAVDSQRADALLAEIERWAERHPDVSSVQSSIASWRGARAYREGCFEDAGRLYDEAATLAPLPVGRVAALCESASSWMEAFCLEEAGEVAARARELALRYRHAWREADAEWVLRTVHYRLGRSLDLDVDLVDAVGRLGVPEMEALAAITEAAIAWRGGDLAQARALASRARDRWLGMGRRMGAQFAKTLEIASGLEATDDEGHMLAAWAGGCRVPGIGVQALALLAVRWPGHAEAWRSAALDRADLVPRRHWGVRQDVLSVTESLEMLGAVPEEGAGRGA